jgi:sugar lactone lactonase YvrE
MKRLVILLVLAAVPALATTTSHWTQANEADFKTGKFHDVVATNLGDLKLSRAVHKLLEEDPKVGAVYALAEAKDGTVYAGTGPQGVLLKLKDDKVTSVAELGDGVNISSLLVDSEGGLLIGTSGTKGEVLRIDQPGEKPHSIFDSDGVQYIWAMKQTADGSLYIATGPNGELFELKPDGTKSTILKTDDNNFTCLATDGKDLLYVGSDPNGLVYRVNRKTRESFVLYNAVETEIGALAVDGKGNLYVGTAQASDQPGPAQEDAGSKDKPGRPEGTPGGVPIPGEKPAQPAPPVNPNPGEPDPLPKTAPKVPMLVDLVTDDPTPAPAPGNPPGNQPGEPNPGAGNQNKPNQPGQTQQAMNQAGTGQPPTNGNAVYKIDPDGFTTEIFRAQVLVLSIVDQNGVLLVGTGSDGVIYQINPAADETSAVARVDAKQVTCLLPTHDGRVIMGVANVGGLASMSSGYATEGTYTSQVFDATQTSKFGKIALHGSLPAGTTMTVSSRSGNLKEPSETGWSKWSPEQTVSQFVQTHSPAARFFQYRITFHSTDEKASPVIRDADVAYLMPNLAPQIKSIHVTPAGKADNGGNGGGGNGSGGGDAGANAANNNGTGNPAIVSGRIETVTWDASDPNNDPLVYTLYFREGAGSPWILLKDKLKDSTFDWDTRTVADGRYEIKVVASDAAANPAGTGKTANRVSDVVQVDNTPPVIGDFKTKVDGDSVDVTVRAVDQSTSVAAVDYSVDSAQDWRAATPSDTMFDGPEEGAHFSVHHLSAGRHQITVRATDAKGNPAYQTVDVTIDKVTPPETVGH